MENYALDLKYFCLELTQVTSVYTLFIKHVTQPHPTSKGLGEEENQLREGTTADMPTPPVLFIFYYQHLEFGN